MCQDFEYNWEINLKLSIGDIKNISGGKGELV